MCCFALDVAVAASVIAVVLAVAYYADYLQVVIAAATASLDNFSVTTTGH